MSNNINNLESIEVKKVYTIDFFNKRGRKDKPPYSFIKFIEDNPESTFKDISNAIVKRRPKKLLASYTEVNAKRTASIKNNPYKSFRAYIEERLKGNVNYFTNKGVRKEVFNDNPPYIVTRKGNFSAYSLGKIEVNSYKVA